jgi:hypothetical protein
MLNRIIFGIILIVSAFVLQWWISFILSLVGLFYFKKLYEVILVGIIIDSLYGSGINIPFFESFNFFFTIILIIALILISKFKTKLLI